MTVKLRYKDPEGDLSRPLEVVVSQSATRSPRHLGFATAVAEFGMLLRASDHRGSASYEQALDLAKAGRGDDVKGYRAEFVRLVELAAALARQSAR
jgi:Ca-activated chloride channel family protein